MTISTLTSDGQITLPPAVRNALGLRIGDGADFIPLEGGIKLVALCGNDRRARGRFKGRVPEAVSLQAMQEAIADSASSVDP